MSRLEKLSRKLNFLREQVAVTKAAFCDEWDKTHQQPIADRRRKVCAFVAQNIRRASSWANLADRAKRACIYRPSTANCDAARYLRRYALSIPGKPHLAFHINRLDQQEGRGAK